MPKVTDIASIQTSPNEISGDALYEVVNDQIVELPPKGTEQEMTAGQLHGHLWSFVTAHGLGRTSPQTLFDFTEQLGKKLRPDVAFISYDRWDKAKAIPDEDGWKVVPNLAVEVISPTNSWEAIQEKVADYFHAGVQHVWLVSPAQTQIHIYESPTSIRILTENDDLMDEQLFPGFRLALRDLFEVGAESGN